MPAASAAQDLKRTQHYHKPGGDWPAFSKQLKRLIRDSIRLSKRRKELSAERFASRRRRLDERLRDLLAQPWEAAARAPIGEATAASCGRVVHVPGPSRGAVDNNHGERQIRPAVIVRKNSYANGSEDGAETQAILMSVFRTLKQRRHNPVSAVLDAVRTYLRTGHFTPLPAKITENG